MAQKIITGFKDDDGVDVGDHLVPKDYLIETYPGLIPLEKASGAWYWGYTGGSCPVKLLQNSSPDWKSVVTRYYKTSFYGVKTDGTLWGFGCAAGGELGNDSTVGFCGSPVQTIAGGNNWVSVHRDGRAIKQDGTLWVWGTNTNGRLGTDDTISRSSPVQTIAGGTNWRYPSGIKQDGTLWAWGCGAFGSIGNNSTIDRSSPVQISGSWKCHCRSASIYTGIFSAGIKTDGTLWVWGDHDINIIGGAASGRNSSPIQAFATKCWRAIGGFTGFFFSGIDSEGRLWLAGCNLHGAIGDNTIVNKTSIVQTVAGGNNWKDVQRAGNFPATVALKTDGTIWAWGENAPTATLGDGTTFHRSSPVQVFGASTRWRSISSGQYNTSAIKEFGEEY